MLSRISYYFVKPFEQGFKITLFRKVLYVFLILNTISLLPIANELFSYNGIVGSGGWNTDLPWYTQGTKAIVNALSHPVNSQYAWVFWLFIFGQLFFLILGILGKWRRLSSILIYFFTVNLFLKGYLMFTGGEALVNILLFYLIFMDEKVDESSGNYQLQNILNNTFYTVIIVQVCVLYFFSTLYKIIDPHWWSGEAMMYISRVDAFSGNTLKFLFADNPMISKVASWMVLLYQGAFPLLVWVKKVKVPFLIMGVLFHLSISIFMGIFTFGIVMIITYLLFLNDQHIQWIGQKLKVKFS